MVKKKPQLKTTTIKRLSYCGGILVARVIERDGVFYADLHEQGTKVDGYGPFDDDDDAIAKWRKLCRKAAVMTRTRD